MKITLDSYTMNHRYTQYTKNEDCCSVGGFCRTADVIAESAALRFLKSLESCLMNSALLLFSFFLTVL